MANTILTHDMLAQRALFDLYNNLVMARKVFKGYNAFFSPVGGFKKGNTARIKLPNKFRTQSGASMLPVDIKESETTITVDQQEHVAWTFGEQEWTLDIENMSEKYLNPAMIAMANKVDSDCFAEYINLYNHLGTPTVTPNDFAILAKIKERFQNEAVPVDGNTCAIWSPKAVMALSTGEIKSVFNSQIVETTVRKGFMGRYFDLEHFSDQNVMPHTVGNYIDTAAVMDGPGIADATSIPTTGWNFSATGLLKRGDVIEIDGVVAVNPISGNAWEGGELRQFVVTADVDSGADPGDAIIPIYPKLISKTASAAELPYQTVVDLPASGAAITVVSGDKESSYAQNLAFHSDCFALTMVPFARPVSAGSSVNWGADSDKQLGLSVTVATAFDLANHQESTRIDILYGVDTIRPELGLRIIGGVVPPA